VVIRSAPGWCVPWALDGIRSRQVPAIHALRTPDTLERPESGDSTQRPIPRATLRGMPVLHPNAPRMITVVVSVALVAVGVILALPIPQLVEALKPLGDVIGPYGFPLTAETGFLFLFAGDALLVAGCLLPGL
jgi:hypothetical protein